ncbi:flagellar motor switch protein FliN [Kistimonas asteriae]|uniref:flagellar motor switch protein FliN n=1 Tax=Kistimonas asteriae TaxID=517724 RepID=UPI001BAAD272|nr:flagellar motor switch protein FliN [Kistimonas asteriae]
MHDTGETDIATAEEEDTQQTEAPIEQAKTTDDVLIEHDDDTRQAGAPLTDDTLEDDLSLDFIGPIQPEPSSTVQARERPLAAEEDEPSLSEPKSTGASSSAATAAAIATDAGDIDLVKNIPVHLTLEVGGRRITIGELMAMKPGDVISLDRSEEEPLDVKANGILIARAEVVLVNERYGIRLLDIVSPSARLNKTVSTGPSS